MSWLARLLALVLLCGAAAWPGSAAAVSTCGGQKDTCKCGKNNPYPCCANGSNCTWWAWHEACCTWKTGLPGWGNANTWASYASKHPDFIVQSTPQVGTIATSTKGKYGHVAWVIGVGNGTVTVREMNCCGTCKWGMITRTHSASYFNSGYIRPKPKGPVCGNGKCEGGESCASCSKDCGGCCGNGKCDHGEKCHTCAKDCVCKPKGALEVAGSAAITGWAKDDNSPGKSLTVEVRSGKSLIGKVKASKGHAKGKGFSLATPAKLCDGAKHTISARAVDLQGKGHTELGSKPLLCRTGGGQAGPWHLTWQRASAIEAAAIQTPGDAEALPPQAGGVVHRQVAKTPYATGGAARACLEPGVQPFEAAFVSASGTWAPLPWTSWLAVVSPSGVSTPLPLGLTGALPGGQQLCLVSQATKQQVRSEGRTLALDAPEFHRAGWRYRIEPQGYGARLDLADPRAPALRATSGGGGVRLWRPVQEPFDRLSVSVRDAAGRASWLPTPVALDGRTLSGEASLDRLAGGSVLALRMWHTGAAPPAGASIALRGLRISRSDAGADGLFTRRHEASYGLGLGREPAAPAAEVGELGLRLIARAADPGWWATGRVVAELRIPGPAFDAVRLRVEADDGVDPDLRLELEAGGERRRVDDRAGQGRVSLPMGGETLAVVLRLARDRWRPLPSALRITGLALRRGGWWTMPSADAAGLLDTRPGSGAVGLSVVAPGARGSWLVQRELSGSYRRMRARVSQDVDPTELRVAVLLDGVVAAAVEAPGPVTRTVTFSPPSGPFADVGLLLRVKPGASPHKGAVVFDTLEVEDDEGVWHGIDSLPLRAEEAPPRRVVADQVTDAGVASDVGPAPPQPSGCGAGSGRGPLGSGGALLALWLALAVALLSRRRAGV